MQRLARIILVISILLALLLGTTGSVASQVGKDALIKCKEFAFSTEEDFVTQGPIPPDTNATISDGDLLGPGCVVCARNADLMPVQWEITDDLGLDAADVIDVGAYLVAFSTELDSQPWSPAQFTAGDLLVTNAVIIPNQVLTYRWSDGLGVGYDIGLDAVQFVGDPANIVGFLEAAAVVQQPITPGVMEELLGAFQDVDIWFSTEGTLGPVDTPAFLDGDLLSVRDGAIVAGNDILLPPSVPAGIPVRGVDFGLDAVTNDRSKDSRQLHFSTEILFDGEPSFTDGDVLRMGNGVVATNYDLIHCFEPRAKELGLDALSVGVPTEPECVSRITKIGGVDVADISPTDGMAFPGTVGTINAPVPFGGWLDIQGSICPDVGGVAVDEFRVVYREAGTGDPWKPIPVPDTLDWKVKADAFFPPAPDCLGTAQWYSHPTTGWYPAADYRHYTLPALGGCNPGLALTVWESAKVPAAHGGPEALYELVLETQTIGGVFSDTVRLVQLDNTAPEAYLKKEAGVCNTVTSTPFMIQGRMKDAHFHSYQLRITGDGYGIHPYTVVPYYDTVSPAATNLTEFGTINWANDVNLHEVDLNDLFDPAMKCGYSVMLTAWDRTLVCNFKFPTNQTYRCPGCRHTGDAWTFNYEPAP